MTDSCKSAAFLACGEGEMIPSSAGNSKEKRITSAHRTKFDFNRATAQNIDHVESVSRINEKCESTKKISFYDFEANQKYEWVILKDVSSHGCKIRNFFFLTVDWNTQWDMSSRFESARNIRSVWSCKIYSAFFFTRVITRQITALSINYNILHKSFLH